MKLQQATKRETFHIAVGVLGFSAVMDLVFVLLKRWDYSVLWGTLLGGGFAIVNFLALALTVQRMAADPTEKRGKLTMQLSYTLRMLFTVFIVALAIKLPGVNWIPTVISLFFPRLTILAMQLLGMYKPAKNTENEKGGDDTV